MCSLINKQLLLTAYAYLFIMEQQKGQQGSEALQLGSNQIPIFLSRSDPKWGRELKKLMEKKNRQYKQLHTDAFDTTSDQQRFVELVRSWEELNGLASVDGLESIRSRWEGTVGSPAAPEMLAGMEKIIDELKLEEIFADYPKQFQGARKEEMRAELSAFSRNEGRKQYLKRVGLEKEYKVLTNDKKIPGAYFQLETDILKIDWMKKAIAVANAVDKHGAKKEFKKAKEAAVEEAARNEIRGMLEEGQNVVAATLAGKRKLSASRIKEIIEEETAAKAAAAEAEIEALVNALGWEVIGPRLVKNPLIKAWQDPSFETQKGKLQAEAELAGLEKQYLALTKLKVFPGAYVDIATTDIPKRIEWMKKAIAVANAVDKHGAKKEFKKAKEAAVEEAARIGIRGVLSKGNGKVGPTEIEKLKQKHGLTTEQINEIIEEEKFEKLLAVLKFEKLRAAAKLTKDKGSVAKCVAEWEKEEKQLRAEWDAGKSDKEKLLQKLEFQCLQAKYPGAEALVREEHADWRKKPAQEKIEAYRNNNMSAY